MDRLSKYGTFIATPPDVTADDTTKLFFKNVFSSPNGEGECTIGAFIFGTIKQSEATRKSPFELVTGRQPLTPNALATSYEGSSPTAYITMKEWHEQEDLARASLDKAC
ncbi:hypothetical protein Tco_0477827 [Tanacetum coccineum]